jgi:hypothetical protein
MPTTTEQTVSYPSPAELLDLSRYPLLDRGEAWERLIAHCKAQLAERGCCELPGFVNAAATRQMAREAAGRATDAYWKEVTGNAYLEPSDTTVAADHPHRLQETTNLGVLAYDQIPTEWLIRRLYEWDPLMDFLATCLGYDRLFRYADPMGALNLAVMKDGDYLRWHFDQTDFVTSIALQSAASGGDFEFVPNIRNRSAENFEAVRAVLRGSRERVQRIPMVPGTLVLFEGRHSLHRVSHIRGSTLRLVALLSYDTRPGVTSTPHLQMMRYGRTVPAE